MRYLSEREFKYFDSKKIFYFVLRTLLILTVLLLCIRLYFKRKSRRNAMEKLPSGKERLSNVLGHMIFIAQYYICKHPAPFHAYKQNIFPYIAILPWKCVMSFILIEQKYLINIGYLFNEILAKNWKFTFQQYYANVGSTIFWYLTRFSQYLLKFINQYYLSNETRILAKYLSTNII